MARQRNIIVISALLGFLAACSSHPFSPDSKRTLNTPKAIEEAEVMALCLSGELTAPDNLYNQIARDLESIRSTYWNSVPKVNDIMFRAPWVVSCVLVYFDDVTAALVSQGTYHAWDELNATYRLKTLDTQRIVSNKFALLYFEGRLHPRRLAELYKGLRGVLEAEPNSLIGDSPNIYPRNAESGITYLFRDGWGDCLSGCIYNEYWYFSFDRVVSSQSLVGHWLKDQGATPSWFYDAQNNIALWRTF